MSARLYQLPGAATEPVVNPPHHRGRWPKRVESLAAFRQWRETSATHERRKREADEKQEQQAQRIPPAPVETGDAEVSELEALREQVEALAKTALRLGVEIIRLQQQ